MNILSPSERCEIVREIRVVLVRHFIDLGRLVINVSIRGAQIRGTLVKLPGSSQRLTPAVVGVILEELHRIKSVKKIMVDFDNWTQDGTFGPWRETKALTLQDGYVPQTEEQQQAIDVLDNTPPGTSP